MSGLSGDARYEAAELLNGPDATGGMVHDMAGSATRGLLRLDLRVTEDAQGFGKDEAALVWDVANDAGSTVVWRRRGEDMAPTTGGASLGAASPVTGAYAAWSI